MILIFCCNYNCKKYMKSYFICVPGDQLSLPLLFLPSSDQKTVFGTETVSAADLSNCSVCYRGLDLLGLIHQQSPSSSAVFQQKMEVSSREVKPGISAIFLIDFYKIISGANQHILQTDKHNVFILFL